MEAAARRNPSDSSGVSAAVDAVGNLFPAYAKPCDPQTPKLSFGTPICGTSPTRSGVYDDFKIPKKVVSSRDRVTAAEPLGVVEALLMQGQEEEKARVADCATDLAKSAAPWHYSTTDLAKRSDLGRLRKQTLPTNYALQGPEEIVTSGESQASSIPTPTPRQPCAALRSRGGFAVSYTDSHWRTSAHNSSCCADMPLRGEQQEEGVVSNSRGMCADSMYRRHQRASSPPSHQRLLLPVGTDSFDFVDAEPSALSSAPSRTSCNCCQHGEPPISASPPKDAFALDSLRNFSATHVARHGPHAQSFSVSPLVAVPASYPAYDSTAISPPAAFPSAVSCSEADAKGGCHPVLHSLPAYSCAHNQPQQVQMQKMQCHLQPSALLLQQQLHMQQQQQHLHLQQQHQQMVQQQMSTNPPMYRQSLADFSSSPGGSSLPCRSQQCTCVSSGVFNSSHHFAHTRNSSVSSYGMSNLKGAVFPHSSPRGALHDANCCLSPQLPTSPAEHHLSEGGGFIVCSNGSRMPVPRRTF